MSEHLMAITTVATEAEAVTLARALLERRLVACVNVLPGARSLYRWQGDIADDAECVLLMKTRRDRFDRLASAIDELHPYQVPELITLPVFRGSTAYLGWIDETLS